MAIASLVLTSLANERSSPRMDDGLYHVGDTLSRMEMEMERDDNRGHTNPSPVDLHSPPRIYPVEKRSWLRQLSFILLLMST